jgi:hypothetical protein
MLGIRSMLQLLYIKRWPLNPCIYESHETPNPDHAPQSQSNANSYNHIKHNPHPLSYPQPFSFVPPVLLFFGILSYAFGLLALPFPFFGFV